MERSAWINGEAYTRKFLTEQECQKAGFETARNEMGTPTVLRHNQQTQTTCATKNTVATRYLMLWKNACGIGWD
ncbi:hypothetical protein FACS189487_10200 [Campylobacterota bacterium]|nr:hypothetical protein FACS189487_10200 [Campylobacterota bacterium]